MSADKIYSYAYVRQVCPPSRRRWSAQPCPETAMAHGRITVLLVLLILLSAAQPSLAQQSNGTSSHRSRTAGGLKPTTVVMLIVVIAALVLITLFSLYMNGCTCTRARPLPRRPFHSAATAHCRPRGGLELELVEAFPTAVYGDVKVHTTKFSVSQLECAVCLAEFADADELRVLPACCHVFHPGCIGPWLAGAVTCPLCRTDLTAETPTGEQDGECSAASFTAESLSSFRTARRHEHELATMGAPDRHTLRLPEHVMKDLDTVRRHRRAASLAAAAEYADAVDQQRTPGWLPSLLRSVSWQRQHKAESSEAGEEHGGGNRRIYPVTGETPSGSWGSGGDDEKKESSDVDPLSRV